MPSAPEPSPEERRLALRARLQAQRESIALQLAGGAHRGYPRSLTMRLLLHRPALVVALVSVLVGARAAGRVHALTLGLRALTAVAGLTPTDRFLT